MQPVEVERRRERDLEAYREREREQWRERDRESDREIDTTGGKRLFWMARWVPASSAGLFWEHRLLHRKVFGARS